MTLTHEAEAILSGTVRRRWTAQHGAALLELLRGLRAAIEERDACIRELLAEQPPSEQARVFPKLVARMEESWTSKC